MMGSRIQSLIEDIEREKPVDLDKVQRLLTLDLAREGERFAREAARLFIMTEDSAK